MCRFIQTPPGNLNGQINFEMYRFKFDIIARQTYIVTRQTCFCIVKNKNIFFFILVFFIAQVVFENRIKIDKNRFEIVKNRLKSLKFKMNILC